MPSKALKWPVEEIPNIDLLYYRVHINNLPEGEPVPGSFKEK